MTTRIQHKSFLTLTSSDTGMTIYIDRDSITAFYGNDNGTVIELISGLTHNVKESLRAVTRTMQINQGTP